MYKWQAGGIPVIRQLWIPFLSLKSNMVQPPSESHARNHVDHVENRTLWSFPESSIGHILILMLYFLACQL